MKALFYVRGTGFEIQCAVYEVAELIWLMKEYKYRV
jgi:hypothetical protein